MSKAAYWYFKPIQKESEENKKELEEFKKNFFIAHTDSTCQRHVVKKAEEFIYNYCNKKNIGIYEQYKITKEKEKEKERLDTIDRMPVDEAYNGLKYTNKSYEKLKLK